MSGNNVGFARDLKYSLKNQMSKYMPHKNSLARDQAIQSLTRSTFDFSHFINFEQEFV